VQFKWLCYLGTWVPALSVINYLLNRACWWMPLVAYGLGRCGVCRRVELIERSVDRSVGWWETLVTALSSYRNCNQVNELLISEMRSSAKWSAIITPRGNDILWAILWRCGRLRSRAAQTVQMIESLGRFLYPSLKHQVIDGSPYSVRSVDGWDFFFVSVEFIIERLLASRSSGKFRLMSRRQDSFTANQRLSCD